MAEKMVQMAKMAPSGLQTPTAYDREKLQPSKKIKLSIMWTHEGRMFNEKIVFLNKSATKFVIIGIHPLTFEPTIRICDRTTGAFINITTLERITLFFHIVADLLNEKIILPDAQKMAGVKIRATSDSVWEISSGEYFGLSLHEINLYNLKIFQQCIFGEVLRRRNGEEFKKVIATLREDIVSQDLKGRHIMDLINNVKSKSIYGNDTVKYNVTFDLICSQEFLKTVPEYAAFYKQN